MTAKYEPIGVHRASTVFDDYGDPVSGGYALLATYSGKFAPNNPVEPVEVGRNAVITGGVVYLRNLSVPPDILHTDHVEIRGTELEINGKVGVWLRSSGWAAQFAVKAMGD